MIAKKQWRNTILFLAIFLFPMCDLAAQGNQIYLGAGYKGGRPHPDRRFGSIINFTNSFEGVWSLTHKGSTSWERRLRSPQTNISLKYTDFGNPFLGRSVAGIYSLGVPIFKYRKLSLIGIFGGGLAYFSEKFHPVKNPENVAIGSDVTFLIRFASSLQYDLGKWRAEFRWDLDHYSTAATSQPNIGININSYGIMIYRMINERPQSDGEEFLLTKKMHLFIGSGFRETDDEQFQHWNLYGLYALPINEFISVGFGSALFFNGSLKREQEVAGIVNPSKIRWGVSAGPQLAFGQMAVNLNMGYYLIDPFNDDGRSFQHTMARYFLSQNFSLGASLIAHNFNESYSFDIGMGISF